MSVNIEDLKPKSFKVVIKGQELECKPLKLSHTLVLTRLGNIFQNPDKYNLKDFEQAENDFQNIVYSLIPILKDEQVEFDLNMTINIVEQLLSDIEPSDNKELKERGVELNSDAPKPLKAG